MDQRVLRLEEVHYVVRILLKHSELVQNKRRFYNCLGLPGGEFFDIEKKAILSGSESYEFFCLSLAKWIEISGPQAKLCDFIFKIKDEEFISAADDLSQYAESGGFSENNNYDKSHLVWFDVPEEIQNFTGRVAELESLHESIIKSNGGNTTVITTVSGLGGIGKTSLAIKYTWQHHKFFVNVIWINAENQDSLEDSFTRLSKVLNIDIGSIGEEKLRDTIAKIYKFFYNRSSLFVFDNAEAEGELLDKFLPTSTSPYFLRPYILLTSRNKEWSDKFQKIELNIFSPTDSLNFLKNYFNLQEELELNVAEKLSETLERLPIAIRQAAAYIKVQKSISGNTYETCIQHFLTEFETNSKSLLSYEYWTKTGDKFRQTTFLTWNITLQKLNANPLAVRLIKIISLLGPDNIPVAIFEHLKKKDILNKFKGFFNLAECLEMSFVSSAIDLLSQYSMVTESQGKLNIHRLVQTVIREQLTDTKLVHRLQESIRLLKHCLEIETIGNFKKSCIVHSKIVLDNSLDKIPLKEYVEFLALVTLNESQTVELEIAKGDELFEQKDYVNAANLYKDAKEGMQQIGATKREMLLLNVKLGIALKMRETYKEALEHYDDVLDTSDFSKYNYSTEGYSNFNGEIIFGLLKIRNEILNALGKENEPPNILRIGLNSIGTNDRDVAIQILKIMAYFPNGEIESAWLAEAYDSNVAEYCLKLLKTCLLIRTKENNEVDTTIQLDIVTMWWLLMFGKDEDKSATFVRSCLQIICKYCSTEEPVRSIWYEALEYDEIIVEFSHVGVELCKNLSLNQEKNIQILLLTLNVFINNFEDKWEDVWLIIYNALKDIENSNSPNLCLAVLLSSFFRKAITQEETANKKFDRENPTSVSPMQTLTTCLLSIVTKNEFDDLEVKENLLENALYFCKTMRPTSPDSKLHCTGSIAQVINYLVPEAMILTPLLLLDRTEEVLNLVLEFENSFTLMFDTLTGTNMLYQISYCLVLGASHSTDPITSNVIKRAFSLCSRSYEISKQLDLPPHETFHTLALLIFCAVFLRQNNLDRGEDQEWVFKAADACASGKFSFELQMLVGRLKSNRYEGVTRECSQIGFSFFMPNLLEL